MGIRWTLCVSNSQRLNVMGGGVYEKVHNNVQNFIDEDSKNADNSILDSIAISIEKATSDVFDGLNNVKIEHCEYIGSIDSSDHVVSFSYNGPERRKAQLDFNGPEKRKVNR